MINLFAMVNIRFFLSYIVFIFNHIFEQMSLSSLSSTEKVSETTTTYPPGVDYPPPSYQYGHMNLPPGIPPPTVAVPPPPPGTINYYPPGYGDWQAPPPGYQMPPGAGYDSQMMYHMPHTQHYPGYALNSGPYIPPMYPSGTKEAHVSK